MHRLESQLQRAILHPEEEVRTLAVAYFSESYSDNLQIMPRVIEAVEKYGYESAFSLLRQADHLPQTAATLDWLIGALKRPWNARQVADDNLRYALSLLILWAPCELLAERQQDLDRLSNLPAELRVALHDRLTLASWPLNQCWAAWEDFGRRQHKRRHASPYDDLQAEVLLAALARFNAPEQQQLVLDVVEQTYAGPGQRLYSFLLPKFFELAGWLRLEPAISELLWQLSSANPDLADSAIRALARIGSNAVVQSIAEAWPEEDEDFHCAAAEVLEKIHTERSEQTCLRCLQDEAATDVGLFLGHAVLAHFSRDGVAAVLKLLTAAQETGDWTNDHQDLQVRLVAVATILEVRFPQYEAWYQEARATNWGWGQHQSARMADGFCPGSPIVALTTGTAAAKPRRQPKRSASKRVSPQDVQTALSQIVSLLDEFCRDSLDQEYAVLCRKLAAQLASERPALLVKGQPRAWAAGIVRTLGTMNFLSDPTQTPHMKLAEVDQAFGVSESTSCARAATIRNLLHINRVDIEWMLPRLMERNPLVWMLSINGLVQDIRDCPREVQEFAWEQGLIPFIPADRHLRSE